jgi:hypothetical protein
MDASIMILSSLGLDRAMALSNLYTVKAFYMFRDLFKLSIPFEFTSFQVGHENAGRSNLR